MTENAVTAADAGAVVERYLAGWNETDPGLRRKAIEEVYTPDATYTDPLVSVTGWDGIEATLAAAQGQFPGLVFRLRGSVDAHHDIARFTWELGPPSGAALVVGFDVAVLASGGRIRAILGFLDQVPASAGA